MYHVPMFSHLLAPLLSTEQHQHSRPDHRSARLRHASVDEPKQFATSSWRSYIKRRRWSRTKPRRRSCNLHRDLIRINLLLLLRNSSQHPSCCRNSAVVSVASRASAFRVSSLSTSLIGTGCVRKLKRSPIFRTLWYPVLRAIE